MPILTVESPEVGTQTFRTADEISVWLADERQFWTWGKHTAVELGLLSFDRRDYFLGRLKKAEAQVNLFKENQSAPHLDATKNLILEYLSYGLWSKSPRASFLVSLRDASDKGMTMAQAAFSALVGDPLNPNSGQQPFPLRYLSLRGRIAIAAFDAGLSPGTADLVSDALREIASANEKAVAVQVETYTAKLDELTRLNATAKKENEELVAALRTSVGAEIEKMIAAKDEAVSACSAARAFYTTDMELRGPVQYWEEKKSAHKSASFWWGLILVFYACAGAALLFCVIKAAFVYATESTNTSLSHTDFLVTGSVAVIITILFWIARFLSRLYLSERHMSIDAASRVTMAKTFLALASNKNVDEKDRGLVLAPLFRAATDGIIKEDTGIDSVLGVLARVLEKPSTGR